MGKAFPVLSVARLVEIIHIELAHKRRKVVVFEVLRKHVLGKLVGIFDDKAIALFVPKHDVRVLFIIHNFERFRQKVWHLTRARRREIIIVSGLRLLHTWY